MVVGLFQLQPTKRALKFPAALLQARLATELRKDLWLESFFAWCFFAANNPLKMKDWKLKIMAFQVRNLLFAGADFLGEPC